MQQLIRPSHLPSPLISLLLVLPWVHPWAPGPESNLVPVLVSWGVLGILLALGQLPSAMDLARAWVWAALISAVIGLIQYFDAAAHFSGWIYPYHGGVDAMGNLRQRNQLATHLAIGMAAVLWWHRQGLRTGHALWMLALMALGLAATHSRTGLLHMLILPAMVACWGRGAVQTGLRAPSWRLALAALGLYLLANGVDATSSALMRMAESNGCSSRRVLWSNVLDLIAQKPLTGWGWGELKFAHYMAHYDGPRFCEIAGNAHNLPLHLAVELGVPLAAAVTLLVLLLLWRAKPWRLQRSTDALAWGVLMPIGVHSLLEYPLWFGPFQLAALGALMLLWPSADAAFARQRSKVQILALAGLCLLPAIAWDYQRVRQVYLPAANRSALWQDNPWAAASQTWFFGGTLRFAQVTVLQVTPQNALLMFEASQATLHDAPEPRVIVKLIESARLSGHEELARWHEAQLKAVYDLPKP